MSEVKLNIIDAQNILTGTIHGSIADRCVAALSAEPETAVQCHQRNGQEGQPDMRA